MKKSLIALALAACSGSVAAQSWPCPASDPSGNQFVPSWGTVEIKEDAVGRYLWQHMYWHDGSRTTDLYRYDSTFEPDVFFYNHDGQAYGLAPWGYWDSNLPLPYVDTQFGDVPGEKAVTIGSAFSGNIAATVLYYVTTRFQSGPGASSWIKLSAQRGVRVPENCYSTFCSFGCSNQPNNLRTIPFQAHRTAPGCYLYHWNWLVTDTQQWAC